MARSCEVEVGMQRLSPRDGRRLELLMRRLDRAAGEINPILTILMVGLLILNLTRLFTMVLPNFPITRVDSSCIISPPTATTGGAGTVNRPG
jgi:hypothetical protein